MRTNTRAEKTERVCLPRRLVPRRPDAYARRVWKAFRTDAVRFCVGDILTIEAFDGFRNYITVLGIQPSGAIDGMVYDGLPHYLPTSIPELCALRVVHVERMSLDGIEEYRRLLGLSSETIEVAA